MAIAPTCSISSSGSTAHSGTTSCSILFDESERACLAYAERIPFEHTAITDAEAEAVKAALGEPGYVAFSVAVSMFDALCRVRMVMDLEGVQNGALHPPASAAGMLR